MGGGPVTQLGNFVDQNANAITGQAPAGNNAGDIFAIPAPVGAAPFSLPYDRKTLPLIIPGPHIIDTNVPRNGYTANLPITVPTSGQAFSPLTLGDNLTVSQLRVQLNITVAAGGSNAALGAFLISPSGTKVALFNTGDLSGLNLTNTLVEGSGANPINTFGAAPYTGVFALSTTGGSLGSFAGQSFQGPWQLEVTNSDATHTATIASWSLFPETSDNEVLNNTNNAVNVTFDRDMIPGSFTSANILSIQGPTGAIPTYSMSTATTIPANGLLNSTLAVTDSLFVESLGVGLTITTPAPDSDANLTVVLMAPDGTSVPLFAAVGGAGLNFTNTTFDDAVSTSIQAGTAPFTGVFKPSGGALAALNGKNFLGTWTLQITNTGNVSATLNSWTLNPFTVTPNPAGTPAALASRTFQIGFPTQKISGSYSIVAGTDKNGNFARDEQVTAVALVPGNGGSNYQLNDVLTLNGASSYPAQLLVTGVSGGAVTSVRLLQAGSYSAQPNTPVGVADLSNPGAGALFNVTFGNEVDSNLNAGVDVLFGGSTTSGALVPTPFPSGTINTPIPAASTIQSIINVPTSFLVEGIAVTLSITHQNDPDLSAVLISPTGVKIPLFSGVGAGVNHSNFTNTTLIDTAAVPIQQATGQGNNVGITGSFNPQQALDNVSTIGSNAQGNWTLQITSVSSSLAGVLNNWTLTLTQSVLGSGLGEPLADRFTSTFRIFTHGPDQPGRPGLLDARRPGVGVQRSLRTRQRHCRGPVRHFRQHGVRRRRERRRLEDDQFP